MKSIKYTDDDLITAVATSLSKREALSKLGLVPAGGNYKCLDTAILRLSLDTSHFLGKGANKGRAFPPKQKIETFLGNEKPIQSFKLKLRLLKEGVLEHKCYSCSLTEWQGQKIPIELEHKDGNPCNNELTNLTLLCPNCHALTSTYRGKNKKRK